jgi:hypothetical protein
LLELWIDLTDVKAYDIDTILNQSLSWNDVSSTSFSVTHQAPNWSVYTIVQAWNEYLFKRANWTYSSTWFSSFENAVAYIDKNAVNHPVVTEVVKPVIASTPKTTNKKSVTTVKKPVSKPAVSTSKPVSTPVVSKPVVKPTPKPVVSKTKPTPTVNTTTRAS